MTTGFERVQKTMQDQEKQIVEGGQTLAKETAEVINKVLERHKEPPLTLREQAIVGSLAGAIFTMGVGTALSTTEGLVAAITDKDDDVE